MKKSTKAALEQHFITGIWTHHCGSTQVHWMPPAPITQRHSFYSIQIAGPAHLDSPIGGDLEGQAGGLIHEGAIKGLVLEAEGARGGAHEGLHPGVQKGWILIEKQRDKK